MEPATDKPKGIQRIALQPCPCPLVPKETARRQMTNTLVDKAPGRAPMNRFAHVREFSSADFTEMVCPQFRPLLFAPCGHRPGWGAPIPLRRGGLSPRSHRQREQVPRDGRKYVIHSRKEEIPPVVQPVQ